MDTKDKARVVSILDSLSRSDQSDPHKFLSEINKAAESSLDQANIKQFANSQPEPTLKQSSLDISKLSEESALPREQLEAIEKTAELVHRLESAGFQRPEKENWVSEMLNNHQRGYLQNDIFTEAAVGLVWMAAKLVEKAFISPDKEQKTDLKSELVSEIKGELTKISKAAEKQLAHSHIRDAAAERNQVMSHAISQARELWKSGQEQKADKLIVQTHNKLTQSARKQFMHYEPSPEHRKVVSQAEGREKERAKLAEKAQDATIGHQKERDRDKGLSL
ncbi:hypothetical protein [Salinimonas chungwhensis]|uniref:hypothetical protein n=1 Tax=Salinimonas chungwhensis TaxID=265425 RepID=UPI00036100C3|nr:hypothetical protein [Salinimonas chungwhensis]